MMAGVLQNVPPPTSCHQLDAVEMLRTLLEKWKHCAPPVLQTDSCLVCVPRVSPTPMSSRVQDTTPVPNLSNNPFHALANDDDEDEPSATTWAPPLLPTSVPRTPAPWARITPLLQATPKRFVFDDLASPSRPTTTPQPSPPPLQGWWQHQALLLIIQGHVLHHTAPQFLGSIGTKPYPDC
jgi:hypothetical protein